MSWGSKNSRENQGVPPSYSVRIWSKRRKRQLSRLNALSPPTPGLGEPERLSESNIRSSPRTLVPEHSFDEHSFVVTEGGIKTGTHVPLLSEFFNVLRILEKY
jgi:hypothetical protein